MCMAHINYYNVLCCLSVCCVHKGDKYYISLHIGPILIRVSPESCDHTCIMELGKLSVFSI